MADPEENQVELGESPLKTQTHERNPFMVHYFLIDSISKKNNNQ
jgi:hypothetical protein